MSKSVTANRSLIHYYDADGKKFKPTITSTPGFSASADATVLSKSIKFWGTNENAIINILGRRTCTERQQIVESYSAQYSRDLDDDLECDLSGYFLKLAVMLTEAPSFLMAKSLYYAMCGIGTNERTLIDVIVTCSNAEIEEVKKSYLHVIREHGCKDPMRTLETDIKAETSGNFCKTLLMLLKGTRDEPTSEQLKMIESKPSSFVNRQLAMDDAKQLYKGGEKRVGTSDNLFMSILTSRSFFNIAAIAKEYEKLSSKSLIQAIEKETSDEFQTLLVSIVQYASERPQFFSKLLFQSMDGPGTRDFLLMRVMVLRAEIDLLSIREAFDKEHGSLEDWIIGDTTGDYRKLLLTLLGSNKKL